MIESNSRRHFLKQLAAVPFLLHASRAMSPAPLRDTVVRPPRLKAGDTIGLVNPAGPTYHAMDLDIVEEILAALGLNVKRGRHLMDRYGYLAGRDEDRAADVNAMFADPAVDAIFAVRGGWGCNRILHLIDYDLIRRSPKIFMGYSDITSLLLALYARAGVVTFHGPVGTSTWNSFSLDYFRRILFEGEAVQFENPGKDEDDLAQLSDRVETITPGKATGIRLSGNRLTTGRAISAATPGTLKPTPIVLSTPGPSSVIRHFSSRVMTAVTGVFTGPSTAAFSTSPALRRAASRCIPWRCHRTTLTTEISWREIPTAECSGLMTAANRFSR